MPQGPHEEPLHIEFEGSIDSSNAHEIGRQALATINAARPAHVELDFDRLTHISSAGIRVIVEILKRCETLSIVNAAPGIYDVLDLTGITELALVRRKLRSVGLDGLVEIGAGAFGRVYRLDAERVMKVYDPRVVPLGKLERERESARQAFIHGIPSAIPFETVRVGREHGIVYELIDARTLGEVVMAEPDRVDEWARDMARLLRTLHETHFEAGLLPDARLIFHGWIDRAKAGGLYAADTIAKLRATVDAIPAGDTFVHGDFHPANIMVMPDGEFLLIDMGDASTGDPIIDLAGTYHVLRVAARRPGGAQRLTGMADEMLGRLWDVFLRTYFETDDAAELERIEQRLRFAALPRTMGSIARSKLIDDNTRRRQAKEAEQAFLAGFDGCSV